MNTHGQTFYPSDYRKHQSKMRKFQDSNNGRIDNSFFNFSNEYLHGNDTSIYTNSCHRLITNLTIPKIAYGIYDNIDLFLSMITKKGGVTCIAVGKGTLLAFRSKKNMNGFEKMTMYGPALLVDYDISNICKHEAHTDYITHESGGIFEPYEINALKHLYTVENRFFYKSDDKLKNFIAGGSFIARSIPDKDKGRIDIKETSNIVSVLDHS